MSVSLKIENKLRDVRAGAPEAQDESHAFRRT